MKKNNFIEKVNNIGLFCKYDLIVYLLTAVIVVSLFLVFALQKNTNGLFDKIVIEKIHAYEFISRLIIHIPEENFKYIRFYGAYCNTTKCHKSFLKLFNEKVIEFKEKANKWRLKIITNFHIDPLSCPICNQAMVYLKSEYF